ncbi:MAG: hypothetical protein V2B14_03270 [bacterium]
MDTENISTASGFWSEKIYVLTENYEITGYVFMPKTGKKNRILTDILNSQKRFLAIKNAQIRSRKYSETEPEIHEFVQLNLNSIVLMRPDWKEE